MLICDQNETKMTRYQKSELDDHYLKKLEEHFGVLKKLVTTVRELKTDSPKTGIFSKKYAKTFKTIIYMFVRIFMVPTKCEKN